MEVPTRSDGTPTMRGRLLIGLALPFVIVAAIALGIAMRISAILDVGLEWLMSPKKSNSRTGADN